MPDDGFIPTRKEATRIQKTVEFVERHVPHGLPPLPRDWRTATEGDDTTGGGTTGTGSDGDCCSTVYPRGSVTLFGVEWATNYDIALPEPIGTQRVTNQGAYWESDDIELTCTAGTDVYRVKMTPSGYGAGEIVVDVYMVTGGGTGGDAACCEDEATGWSWRLKN